MVAIDSETAWRAILERNDSADGDFVFGVTSTGVYCRPGCPARTPRRENVRLFATADEAEMAGFRECRRCLPRSEPAARRMVNDARQLLEAEADDPPGLEALAAQLGVSAGHLQRTFKRLTGVSPRQFAANRRAEAFKTRLRSGEDVTTATYAAGYGSLSRVYDRSAAMLGMTPGAYRRGGDGITVSYTTIETPVGRVLLAATARGVCFIAIVDSDEEIEAAVRAEYPRADLRRDDDALSDYADVLRHYLASGMRETSLPLDLRGSAFQMLVWQALRSIPAGETRSYSEIAASIGRPEAARAVARACATNPVPLVVPCHRAIQSNGEPGGYRWGAERKKALLAKERATAKAAPETHRA
jgi:AraC family transcriptional regulator of adaptative response/methylated-DNA-[protein]-cysteine methyltransferase